MDPLLADEIFTSAQKIETRLNGTVTWLPRQPQKNQKFLHLAGAFIAGCSQL
jgi:hypothetical protein